MFQLLRYFSLCCAAVMVIATVVLAYVYRDGELRQMVQVAETQNLALARSMANTIGDGITAYVAQVEGIESEVLRKAPQTEQWRETFKKMIKDLPVLKVKFYSPAGVTRYSSEPAQIGAGASHGVPFKAAVEHGRIHSTYEFRKTFAGFDGPVTNRYVVSSYVPVQNGSGKVGAVLEIYTDITMFADDIGDHIGWVVAALSGAFAVLFGVLFGIVRHADSILARQYGEVKAFNETLEARVSERTKAAEDAAEQLKAANRALAAATQAKSMFLANMSHEIRTPMNGVFGMTDLLLRTDLSEHQHRLVSTIGQSARSLLTVINDILDFSRIEAGKLEVDRHEFDLRHCIEGAVDLFVDSAARKKISLALFVSSDAPAVVWGDKGRLRQICVNLIGNAIKFTETGEVSIRVTAQQNSVGSAQLEFQVRDTGMGIDPAAINKLLAPFAQADSSVSRRFGGTGLGLSISRHLVELMHGTLTIASKVGEGTTISFKLPMEIGDSSKASRLLGRELPADTRILVIDDRETNREILTSYLSAAGAVVETTESARTGLKMLMEAASTDRPYSVAIVDVVMPDMSGVELLKEISAQERLGKLKTVLVTSMSWAGDIGEARQLGAHALLTKPVREVDLITSVARAVGSTARGTTIKQVRRSGGSAKAAAASVVIDAKVLVAEDNPVNIEVAKEFLSLLGARVKIAENGRQAVAACEHEGFDVVLMDCQMPEMDGMTATGLIRRNEQAKGLARMPIIAVTANAYDEDRDLCLAAGMDDYLSKPFTEVELVAVLSKWVPAAVGRGQVVQPQVSDPMSKPAAAECTPELVGARELVMPAAPVSTPTAKPNPQPAVTAERSRPMSKKQKIEAKRQKKLAAKRQEEPAPKTTAPARPAPERAVVAPSAALPAHARPALFERLKKAMLQQAPEVLVGLRHGVRDQDVGALGRHAHSLKSAAASLGENELSDLCGRLEKAAAAGDLAACGPLVVDIVGRVEALLAAYATSTAPASAAVA